MPDKFGLVSSGREVWSRRVVEKCGREMVENLVGKWPTIYYYKYMQPFLRFPSMSAPYIEQHGRTEREEGATAGTQGIQTMLAMNKSARLSVRRPVCPIQSISNWLQPQRALLKRAGKLPGLRNVRNIKKM